MLYYENARVPVSQLCSGDMIVNNGNVIATVDSVVITEETNVWYPPSEDASGVCFVVNYTNGSASRPLDGNSTVGIFRPI